MLLKRIWGMGLVLMVFVGGVTLSACSQATAGAAEVHAFRWQAMVDFYARYARHGILYE